VGYGVETTRGTCAARLFASRLLIGRQFTRGQLPCELFAFKCPWLRFGDRGSELGIHRALIDAARRLRALTGGVSHSTRTQGNAV